MHFADLPLTRDLILCVSPSLGGLEADGSWARAGGSEPFQSSMDLGSCRKEPFPCIEQRTFIFYKDDEVFGFFLPRQD